jgi:dTDP-4-dehydrorhamnose 3,5-epimerase
VVSFWKLTIRHGTPNWESPRNLFKTIIRVILSSQKQNQIYIPAGFAHGFLALTETVQFLYKCNEYYDPKDEYGILWNDPEIGISWGVSSPVLSEKDSRYSPLAGISRELLPKYSTK